MTAEWVGVLAVAFLLLVVTLYSLQVAFRNVHRQGSPDEEPAAGREMPEPREPHAEGGPSAQDESLPKAA